MPHPLQVIPGVGPSIAQDLRELGVHAVSDLVGRDPDELYARRCAQQGVHIDRCLLYVFRSAIYFAENEWPGPVLTLWWNWKDAADPPLHLLGSSRRRAAGLAR